MQSETGRNTGSKIIKIDVHTNARVEFKDVTGEIGKAVSKSNIENGICYIFVPHTTAGITINENADPDVREDMIATFNKVIPFNGDYAHIEGNSAAHIKASIMGFSEIVLIENGKLQLGHWQGIYFCEFDGPRHRKLWIKSVK
ncbi:MAG: secondary thiamine-phosphate synthase enzyme YjbQ [Candidatus Firestonebacteria bacterium]